MGEGERERETKRGKLTKSVHHLIQPSSTFTTGGALEREIERERERGMGHESYN